MKCESILDRLDDYVDGALSEADFQEFELHLQGCPSCREEERLLRSVLTQAAALPKEMAPPRDLWGGIAERLSERKPFRLGGFFLSPFALAAASVVIALVATRYIPHGKSAAPSPGPTQTTASFDPSLVAAEQQYGRAATALKSALDAKRGNLAPETRQKIDNDLKVIDTALESLRTALQKDPENQELAQLLIATNRKKVDVLQKLADAL